MPPQDTVDIPNPALITALITGGAASAATAPRALS